MRHLVIRVTGLVQGVFFRVSTQEAALRIGVAGTVRNEPEGTVLIEAEGTEEQLDRFLEWVRHGPPHARVDRVDTEPAEVRGHEGFRVV